MDRGGKYIIEMTGIERVQREFAVGKVVQAMVVAGRIGWRRLYYLIRMAGRVAKAGTNPRTRL